ncbi:hypothetical protein [Chryseolinea sp. H1M3-3]|uniref:hypothetical protein n=1 Tax=Chryseolinea sp. H1M3-3 TaxID=3034144 RepID=UPI0023ECE195|nr:hypothetical protein [Chryseolinea sp. H1M3-3]
MEREIFTKGFIKSVDEYFESLRPFYDHDLRYLPELATLKFEILNCLMLGFYQASICTTNHFVERMLKLSLMKNHTKGYNYSDMETYTVKLKESKKFDDLTLNQSLALALEKELISNEQYEYLKKIKNHIRNPYSHAHISKITQGAPESVKMFRFSFDDIKSRLGKNENLGKPESIEIPSYSPAIAQFYQEHVSKLLGFQYFRNVYAIARDIEKKI